ncbi:MAG: super-infection exclusion protein B [Bacteroidota bacterium]
MSPSPETKSWIATLSTFLPWTILLLSEDLFHWFDDTYSERLSDIVPYRYLLKSCLLLLCLLLALIIRHFTKPRHAVEQITAVKKSVPTRVDLENSRKRLLENLSGMEKQLLREYISRDVKTLTLNTDSMTIKSLKMNGILLATTSTYDYEAQYTISNWAWDMLRLNPRLLE